MGRRIDRQGEILIWCRGNARAQKSIDNFETNSGFSRTAEFLQRKQQIGNLKDKKKRITRKEYQRLFHKFKMEGFMAQKGLWNLARNKALQDRGALPREEGDTMREYKAMQQLLEGRWER